MAPDRKYVLTVAGFDPSGGAGVLADIKTFERHKVYGLAVNTAVTVQTETVFHS
ncbi:MAG: bifunctional hydroxymethylpyrimidine kinase/phosphomethylpyrimidine kinase, partial [Bacteroidia bacterium]